jgi:copper chaperone CopZ
MVLAVVLKVHMHCEACAQVIKKKILKMKGTDLLPRLPLMDPPNVAFC